MDYFTVFASVPGTITSIFYENYEMISPIYIERQLTSFPHKFSDDTLLEYNSIKFSTAFIVPVSGNYKFYIIISK